MHSLPSPPLNPPCTNRKCRIFFLVTGLHSPSFLSVTPERRASGVLQRLHLHLPETGVFVKVVGVIGNVEMSVFFFRASFMTKTVPCGNELHKFLIWDTAGQERVRTCCYWLSRENPGGKNASDQPFLCIWQDYWLLVIETQLDII